MMATPLRFTDIEFRTNKGLTIATASMGSVSLGHFESIADSAVLSTKGTHSIGTAGLNYSEWREMVTDSFQS